MERYPDAIFVYGANLKGRHGKGAAKEALNYGAIEGKIGYSGRSYGIPTKNTNLGTMLLEEIKKYVDEFIIFATMSPDKLFILTRIGCGLARHSDEEMVKLFDGCPTNVIIPLDWRQFMVPTGCGALE